jgi:hypothetical protein
MTRANRLKQDFGNLITIRWQISRIKIWAARRATTHKQKWNFTLSQLKDPLPNIFVECWQPILLQNNDKQKKASKIIMLNENTNAESARWQLPPYIQGKISV